MPVFGTQMFGSGGATYEIDNSCVFDAGSTASMSRTPGSAGNQKILTQSIWVKRGKLGTDQTLGVNVSGGVSTGLGVWFNGDDTMSVYVLLDSTWVGKLTTTQVFRDPSAWYHVVFSVDTPQATASNRIKLYINGSQVTDFSVDDYPDQDTTTQFNNTVTHYIGRYASSASYWADMYQAEHHWIDGTALTPSSFGETNDEGVWVPKKYSGSYGTTGFYLDYADSSDLGDDESGQGNDWAESNLAATDQSTDTPTNNHCTLNVLDPITGSVEVTEGAKQVKFTGGDQDSVLGTIFQSKGKWYWEMKYVTAGGGGNWGITRKNFNVSVDFGSTSGSYAFRSGGGKINNNSAASYGSAWSADDIIQCAWDADNGKVFFGINNTWQASGDPTAGDNPAYSSIGTTVVDGGGLGPGASSEGNTVYLFRFTEAECSYDPPTGFKHLNTANIAEPSIKDPSTNFQAQLYAGNGTAIGSGGKVVTFGGNSDMQSDFVWIKNRSATDDHSLFDAARGVTKELELPTAADQTTQSEGLTAFGSDGFTVGNRAQVNTSSENFVSWNWKESATAGFDIVTYTGTGVNRTVSHSLGAAPDVMIMKETGAAGDTADWFTYHSSNTSAPATDFLRFNTNAVTADSDEMWNDTAPTSSVFTVGIEIGINGNTNTYVAYLFTEIEGFSKFGTYTGNGNADGPFIYTGFKPRWFVQKATAAAGQSWCIIDRARTTYNGATSTGLLFSDSNSAEYFDSNHEWDFLSNGIKQRGTGNNGNGTIYVYMAFAENPFGGEDVAPATAV